MLRLNMTDLEQQDLGAEPNRRALIPQIDDTPHVACEPVDGGVVCLESSY